MIFKLIFLLFLLFSKSISKTCKKSDTCETEECQELAKKFKENGNSSVDPCDDFYEFACGNYDNIKQLPKYQIYQSTLEEMQNIIDDGLIKLLESKNKSGPTKAFEYVQGFYKSCLDEKNKEKLDKMTLGKMIRTKFGDWNLLSNKTESSEEFGPWEILAGNLSNYDIHTIIKLSVSSKVDGSPRNSLMIEAFQSSLENKFEFLMGDNSTALSIYHRYIARNMGMLDIKDEKIVDSIIKFETELVKCALNVSGKYTQDGIEITYAQLKERHPTIKFDLYFNQVIRDGLRGEFNNSMKIQLTCPDYLTGLEGLLKVTSAETIKNYMMWRYVASMVKYLSEKWRNPMSEMHRELYGSDDGMSSTNVTCMRLIREKLWLPLAHEYFKTYFTKEDKQLVEEMSKNLKAALKIEIEEAEWIDEETRKLALEKLEKMRSNIGYPKKIENKNEINRPFRNLIISDDYLINAMRVQKMVFLEELYRIQEPRGYPWERISMKVNAFYDFYSNMMVMPAAISHFPLLIQNAPEATNYGSYGSAIGHEMTHGYDHQGRFFDENGVPSGWWDNVTSLEFLKKASCIVWQYENETEVMTGNKINGLKTLGENIADNGALRMAWSAYKEKLKTSKNPQKLKGLNYNSDQLFFIAYANNFCTTSTKTGIEHLMNTDSHTFGSSRINVPLMNFETFADTFNCPDDAPMRLEKDKICRVW